MKKLIILFILLFTGIIVHAQSTRVMESNLTLKKTTPTFYLQGTGSNINFNNVVTLTQTGGRLQLSGGDLYLGSNNLILTGQIGVLLGRVATIYATDTYTTNLLSYGSSVIGTTGDRFLKGWFTNLEITNTPTINGVAMPVANWNTAYTDRLKWDGGSTDLVAATGRTSLGATTVGSAFFTLTNPSAITFPRINANNTVSTLSAADFTTAIGAGHVTSITGTFTAGALTDITLTGVTTKPFNIMIQTTGGKDITSAVSDSLGISGGTYHLYVYSVDLITDAEIKVTH